MTAPENALNYRIGGMDLISCNLAEPKPDFAADQKLNFNLQMKHQIIEKDSALAVICTIRTADEAGTELAHFTGRMTFAVDQLSQHLKKNDDGQIGLPKDLINNLNGVTISTLRGVMWATFKGTYLHRALLPIVNPEGFQAGQHA